MQHQLNMAGKNENVAIATKLLGCRNIVFDCTCTCEIKEEPAKIYILQLDL